ncbi:hypothetical protein [Hymenobacter sp.]|jgi:hypothetical protein|uniref:hypothetical protein n=1 Tax=Hymenobacter sp. TaxID=1898978 RepID=UPI002EDA211B
MERVKEHLLSSGYQSQQAPPSNGRALSVLVAVCAVLWVWANALEWYAGGFANREAIQALRSTLYNGWILSLLTVVSNAVVWRWVTVPLWRNACINNESNLVLGLAILFHLAFLLLLFLVVLLLIFDSNEGPFLGY